MWRCCIPDLLRCSACVPIGFQRHPLTCMMESPTWIYEKRLPSKMHERKPLAFDVMIKGDDITLTPFIFGFVCVFGKCEFIAYLLQTCSGAKSSSMTSTMGAESLGCKNGDFCQNSTKTIGL